MLLLYQYQNGRYISASLIASFLFTIRQELAVLAVLLAVPFLLRRQWLPLLCLLAAPLAMTLLGFIKHHDLLYIVNGMIEGGFKESYRRNGFFYLWVMLPDVMGIVIFYLVTTSAVAFTAYEEKRRLLMKYHMPILVAVVYFLMHCTFTSEMFGFGRSGGATRFLLPVLPVGSLLALGGLNFLVYYPERRKRVIAAAVSFLPALSVVVFLDYLGKLSSFGFNALSFTGINIVLLTLLFLAVLACIMRPEAAKRLLYAVPVLVILYSVKCAAPIGLSNEVALTGVAADWLYDSNLEFDKLYTDHVVFNYYYGLKSGSYEAASYDSLNFTSITAHDIIMYDTHYASKLVTPQFFNKFRDRYQVLNQFIGENNFKIFLLRGIAAP